MTLKLFSDLLPLVNFIVVIGSAMYVIIKVRAAVDQTLAKLAQLERLVLHHDRKLIEVTVACAMRHGGRVPSEEAPELVDGTASALA